MITNIEHDRYQVPEYVYDAPVNCHECLEEYDEDHIGLYIFRNLEGDYICENCRQTCEFCGEWMHEPSPFGTPVSIRLWYMNGKRYPHHAMCAATEILCNWHGTGSSHRLEIDDVIAMTREEVDAYLLGKSV